MLVRHGLTAAEHVTEGNDSGLGVFLLELGNDCVGYPGGLSRFAAVEPCGNPNYAASGEHGDASDTFSRLWKHLI